MANRINLLQQKTVRDRTLEVIKNITDNNLAEVYARYENKLLEEADCGNDKEEYEFLIEITEFLRWCIVQKYMEQKGWIPSPSDEWNRWERIRG